MIAPTFGKVMVKTSVSSKTKTRSTTPGWQLTVMGSSSTQAFRQIRGSATLFCTELVVVFSQVAIDGRHTTTSRSVLSQPKVSKAGSKESLRASDSSSVARVAHSAFTNPAPCDDFPVRRVVALFSHYACEVSRNRLMRGRSSLAAQAHPDPGLWSRRSVCQQPRPWPWQRTSNVVHPVATGNWAVPDHPASLRALVPTRPRAAPVCPRRGHAMSRAGGLARPAVEPRLLLRQLPHEVGVISRPVVSRCAGEWADRAC